MRRIMNLFVAGLLLAMVLPGAMAATTTFSLGGRTVSYDTVTAVAVGDEYHKNTEIKGAAVTYHRRNIGKNITINGGNMGPMAMFSLIEFEAPFNTTNDLDLYASVGDNLGIRVYKDAEASLATHKLAGGRGVIGTIVIPDLDNLEVGAGCFLIPGSTGQAVSFVVYGNPEYNKGIVDSIRVF